MNTHRLAKESSDTRISTIKILSDHEFHLRQPIITVQTVSDIICKQILIQTSGQIILPSSQSAASVVYAMPTWMQERIRTFASGSLPRMHNVQPYEK